jgi:hypothetical protein
MIPFVDRKLISRELRMIVLNRACPDFSLMLRTQKEIRP